MPSPYFDITRANITGGQPPPQGTGMPSWYAPQQAAPQPGGIAIQNGGFDYAPTLNAADIKWNEATQDRWITEGGDGGSSWLAERGNPAGYGYTGNVTGTPNERYFTNPNNYSWSFDKETGAPSLRIKSGDQIGTTVGYVKQGDQWVPDYGTAKDAKWDTNRGNRSVARGLGSVLGAGLLGAGMAAYGVAGGLGAEAAGAGAGLTELGSGAVPALTSASTIAEPAAGWTLGSAFDTAKQAYDVYGKVKKGINLYNQFTQDPNVAYAGGSRNFNEGSGQYRTGPSSGGSTPDWMSLLTGGNGQTGLLDLWGAYEGSRQTKDYSGNMKRLYDEANARRQPVLDRLNESYTNPNSFYDSNQWKGLESVYQNSIDRKAAQAGRLANPTDREVLLQQHAMKGMEDYRQGLRDEAKTLSPDNYIPAITRGYELESRANNPWGAMVGRAGVGGGPAGQGGGIQDILTSAYGGLQQIPAAVRKLFPDLFGDAATDGPELLGGSGDWADTGRKVIDMLGDFSDWWA